MTNDKKNNEEACPKGKKDCPIFDELTQLRAEVETLRAEVIRDYLTDLYNPRHLDFCLGQELERTLRTRQPTTVIMLDIDYFKKVNDNHGHAAGDNVLKHIARILTNSVRKLDVCCRSGGEEFTIILPSTPLLIGIQVAERIRKYIEETTITLAEGEINITASFGVNAFTHKSEIGQQAFLESVDAQLYRAKKSGRNKVCSAPQEELGTRHVSADERAALFGNESENNTEDNE